MNDVLFCISYDSYFNNISKGFSYLQQNSEFVDMTLAADGHLVKVHQNIVALASPYLKAMLQSASCRHPVIFLNNISSEVLCYILEYIYTGEVKVPTNIIDVFIKACKSLYIKGIDTITPRKNMPATEVKPINKGIDNTANKNIAAHITINTQDNNYNLEVIQNQNNSINDDGNMGICGANLKLSSCQNMRNGVEEKIPYGEIKEPCENSIIINNGIMPPVDPSTISHRDSNLDVETEMREIVDISSINNFVILEPKYDGIEVNKNKQDNLINILGDIVIKEPNTKTNITNQSSDLQKLVSNYQHFIQNSSEKQLIEKTNKGTRQTNDINNISQNEMKPNSVLNLNNIVLDKGYWQQQPNEVKTDLFNITPVNSLLVPGQSNSNSELETKSLQNYNNEFIDTEVDKESIVLKAKRQDIQKNLKKIASLIKSKNKTKFPNSSWPSSKVGKFQINQALHFTISTRGTLQLMLHRFLYNNHHQSHGGRKRRWRCIDYRKMRCPAFVDTENDTIKTMLTDHLHPDHDNMIKKKIKTNLLFTSLTDAITSINTIIKEPHKRTQI